MSTQVSNWSTPISKPVITGPNQPPMLRSSQMDFAINEINSLQRPSPKLTFDGHPVFKAKALFKSSHIQTIWGVYRKKPEVETQQSTFTLQDGDYVKLSFCHADSDHWVIILHGLTGCSDASYILGIQKALALKGFNSVTLNYRGADGEPNRQARAFHAGHTADFLEVLAHIKGQPNVGSVSALGYSLGANILLKALGESPNLGLATAVAVSPPFDLQACANHVDKGFSRIYRNYLLNRLKKRFIKKRNFFLNATPQDQNLGSKWHNIASELRDIGCIKSIRSFWSYDNFVVAPLEGFRNVHHYYQTASSMHYLKAIKTPTLIICAKDDPIVPKQSIPDPANLSQHTHLEVYQQGGHQGFLQLCNNRIDYWLEKRVPHFFSTILHKSLEGPNWNK